MTRGVPAIAALPADLRDALNRLVADAAGPFGATPLTRLMTNHLAFFSELRGRGASWAQVAGMLAGAGIVGSDGTFAADVVRATYSRTAKAAGAMERKRTGPDRTKRDESDCDAAKRGETQRNATKRGETKPEEAPSTGPSASAQEQDEAAPTPRNTKRAHAAPDTTDETKPDRSDDSLADLFRRAAFLNDPPNTR
jgi:hypothetical protein